MKILRLVMARGQAPLEKSSSSLTGQVTLEYFIIFTVIALVTLVSLTNFDDNIVDALKGFFQAAAKKMAN